jgi:hypothetical protein
MRRLEIIHLRWTGPRPADLFAAIRETVAGLGGPDRVEVLRHEGVPTDVAIHLRHEDDTPDPDLTELGMRLAAALREVGMVEHSIWLEEEEGRAVHSTV